MVVEDEPVVAHDIRHRLEKLGYAVTSLVDTGEAALERLESELPDLILMDIMLAGELDGIQTAATVAEKHDLPVVYLTAHTDEETLARAKITEPFGYVIKPFEDRDILTTVEMAAYRHQTEKQKKEAERWLFSTLRSIGDGVVTTDEKGNVTYINALAADNLGLDPGEASGVSAAEILRLSSEEGGELTDGLLRDVLERSGKLRLYDASLTLADGGKMPVEVTASPISGANGSVAGVVVAYRDIRERKKARRDLIRSEQRFRQLYENIPLGYFTLDPAGRICEVNKTWLEMLGYRKSEVLGRRFEEFLAGEDRESCAEARLLGEGLELSAVRKDGERLIVQVQAREGYDALEGERFTYCIMLDVTEKRQAELKVVQQNEFLSSVVESIPHPFFVVGADDSRVQMANSAARGLGDSELGVYIRGNGDGLPSPLSIVKNSGRPMSVERTVDGAGGQRHVEIHAYPVYGPGEEISQVIEYALDVTERKNTEQALKKSVIDLRKTLEETVNALAVTSEKRDPYTAGHQQRVAQLACAIARLLGLDSEQVAGIRVCALLHDIGKIYIPAEILAKPAKLTSMEFGIMQTHSEVGYDILKRVPFPWPVARVVLQHHERLDGSGYPEGLRGEEMIIESRIIAVADVVEAMSSHRPYRAALGLERALAEIEIGRTARYDAEVVDACLSLFRDRSFQFE
jgi:PAS domain S-box-containing protein/putative nucleotidyltransferase with HDIG domain